MNNSSSPTTLPRRQFLASTGTAIAASVISKAIIAAPAPAKYTRYNLTDPKSSLASYEKAVTAMLKLPPSDARNWYRNAFIHILDCPHQNWWFLPWHRGYLGWFEQTCRDLSGDANFALPYWDWTSLPQLPAPFFTGALNPSNPLYLASRKAFTAAFKDPVSDLWKSFTPDQLHQLNVRGFTTESSLWDSLVQSFPLGSPRRSSLTPTSPSLESDTLSSVALSTIQDALSAQVFAGDPSQGPDYGFGSYPSKQHSQRAGESELETSPHDNVHGDISGFMGRFLSPVDPIFFMHHCNLDRLWDVWTRKQTAAGLPTVPTGTALTAWNNEPFLFYIGPDGKSVAKTKAGDYATIGDFNYNYQPGSGESPPPLAANQANQVFALAMAPKQAGLKSSARGAVMLPKKLSAAAAEPQGSSLFARITLKPGTETSGVSFRVLVNPPTDEEQIPMDHPSFAGTIRPFDDGLGNHGEAPKTFTISLTNAVRRLTKAGMIDPEKPLQVQVVASRNGIALAPVDLDIENVVIGSR